MNENQAEKEAFIRDKQDSIMELVYLYLKDEGSVIDNENIRYFRERYKFTEKEFCLLCDNVLGYAENASIAYVRDSSFPNMNCYLVYKELKIVVRMAIGQGTMFQMRTDLEDEWDGLRAFCYEEYKTFEKI